MEQKIKNKRFISLTIIICMLFTLSFNGVSPLIAKAENSNMIENGDVSEWDGDKPVGWNKSLQGISKEESNVHSAPYAIKQTASKKRVLSTIIDGIEAGKEYTIRYWYYDNGDARTRPWMSWMTASGSKIKDNKEGLQPTKYFPNEDGWKKWEVTLVAPENAAKFNYEIRTYKEKGSGGDVFMDDFYFGPKDGGTTPEPTKVANVTATPKSGKVPAGTSVELKTQTEGADIYYQLGEETLTTTESAIKYDKAIEITKETKIHALAVKVGLENSDESVFEYSIETDDDYDKIYDIQGAGHTSPMDGDSVKIKGIVTAVSDDYHYGGIWVQEVVGDDNDNTSDGIYVAGKSISANQGDIVTVEGYVAESEHTAFDGHELTITEIVSPTVNVISSNNPLPEAVVIGNGDREVITDIIDDDNFDPFDPKNDAIDLYESLEGMLVKVNNPLIVGVAEKYGTFSVLADGGEASTDKLSIKKGIIPTAENKNPEVLHFDDVVTPVSNRDKVFTDSRFAKAKVGDSFEGSVIGVMDYNFGFFKIYNIDRLPDLVKGNNERETTDITFDKDKLTVATYNIENFSADPSHTPDEKVAKIADSIINDLGSPDIIALVEVQDNNGPQGGIVEANESYMRLINKIKQLNGPTYAWTDVAPVNGEDGGQPGGNIRVGYIYRVGRVGFQENKGTANEAARMDGKHLAKNPSRVEPTNSSFDSSRKPVVAEFTFRGESIFMIGNHMCSKRGDESDFGAIQPPVKGSEDKRHEQARAVNRFVKEIVNAVADANVVVLGDMNDYEYSGTLDLLKGDEMINVIESLPKNERYTYVYNGSSQVLDSILITKNIQDNTVQDIVHLNAEFTDRSGRASDHDPILIQISGLEAEENVGSVISEPDKAFFLLGEHIVLRPEVEGREIYYTTSESEDPRIDGIKYEGDFILDETGEFHYRAVCKNGDEYGEVLDISFVVDYSEVNFSLEEGEVEKGSILKIQLTEEDGVDVYYATDETTPYEDYIVFPSDGITINEETTVKVVLKKGGEFSNILRSRVYTVASVDGTISIKEAREKSGEEVKIKGVVTGLIGNNIFMQDDTAGIYLYVGKDAEDEFVVGNILRLKGTVAQFNGLEQLKSIKEIEVIAENQQLPKAKEMKIGSINEAVEGQLVTIKNVEITAVTKDMTKDYSIKVSDGENSIKFRVDKHLEPGVDSNQFETGMMVDVTAPVGQFYENYQFMIRSSADIKVAENIQNVKSKLKDGTVILGTVVELYTETMDCEILYTMDGSNPKENGIKYESPIDFNEIGEITVKAVAKKAGVFGEINEFHYNVIEGSKEIKVNYFRAVDEDGNEKSEFNKSELLNSSMEIETDFDTESEVIVKVESDDFVYSISSIRNLKMIKKQAMQVDMSTSLYLIKNGIYRVTVYVVERREDDAKKVFTSKTYVIKVK